MAFRREIVRSFSDTMLDAMIERGKIEEISQDETIAAVMTTALRMIQGAKKLGADPKKLRAGVEVLLMECADDKLQN